MGTNVLVVEDDLEINELLGEYLALEGIAYHKALTGKEALDQLTASAADAVVLDLMLPDIDGYEVCRRITARRSTHQIPVIMLTCMCQESDRFKGLASGAFRYMTKPFLPDDLLANLRDALEWKQRVAQHRPTGQILVSTADPLAALQGINQMAHDLLTHSRLSDHQVELIRDAFTQLTEWALSWGKSKAADPQLQIEYRLLGSMGMPLEQGPAGEVEWVLSERAPALLTDTIFKVEAASNAMAVPWLSNHEAVECNSNGKRTGITGWYEFIAHSGATRFDKDTKSGTIRILRSLPREETVAADLDPPVPVVVIDGHRLPTRLRDEAQAAKKRR